MAVVALCILVGSLLGRLNRGNLVVSIVNLVINCLLLVAADGAIGRVGWALRLGATNLPSSCHPTLIFPWADLPS